MSTKTLTEPDEQTRPKTNGRSTRPARKEAVILDGPLASLAGRFRGRRWRESLTRGGGSLRSSRPVRRGVFYGAVLLADWLLVVTTVFGLIPLAGAWLHEQSGLTELDVTGAGTIALWLGPFAFTVALITVGEIALMKSLWRWAGRKAGTQANEQSPAAAKGDVSAGTSRPVGGKKNSNRRRKR